MVASRTLALGGYASTRIWFSAFCIALMPTSVGYQDFAAMLAHHPNLPRRTQTHLIASPFGTIEPATFSYGIRPIGTAIPQPPSITLVNFDPRAVEATSWPIDRPVSEQPQIVYPMVNRLRKGDRLPATDTAPAPVNPASLPQLQPIESKPAPLPMQPPAIPPAPAATPRPTHAEAPLAAPQIARRDAISTAVFAPAPIAAAKADRGPAAAISPGTPADGQRTSPQQQAAFLASLAFADDGPQDRTAQSFFGAVTVDDVASGLERWRAGADPVLTTASIAGTDAELEAGKDESRLESPAQRLGLAGKARAKAEKCLADAVYFEARGEPLRGQQAVAQVVVNRVFSGYYPNNVCGVVYQNASHYLACQFTFACEHRDLTRIDEPDMWAQAKRIAKDTLDGKIWLPDIGHATHYHAYWVHPNWVHEMTRLYKLGEHTFYRPRAWGNGNSDPVWGATPTTSKADSKAAGAAKGPQANAAPASAGATTTASDKL
jgi:Cell Wall Hydrolase